MENYDELFKKMVAALFGCVLCWLIGHLFASCTPGRQVTGSSSHRTDTVYAVKTVRDTARVTDSVIVRVTAKGDTVYKTKETWRERERVRWRVDTVYKAAVRTDTIRVPAAVERKVPLWKRVVYNIDTVFKILGPMCLIGFILYICAWARGRLTRRKE